MTNDRAITSGPSAYSVMLMALLAISGCAGTTDRAPRYNWVPERKTADASGQTEDVRRLPAYRGSDGAPLSWPDVLGAAAWADVVLVGEVHTDAVAHRLQLELLRDITAHEPRTTLSLEFLERNEQPLIDAYLDGSLSRQDFIEKTKSANGSGEGGWEKFYQPLVDWNQGIGARVIGANPPRALAKLAREKGFDALRELPTEEQPNFTLPSTVPTKREKKRFRDTIVNSAVAHGSSESEVSDELVASFERAQELWNSTMAASILAEHERGAPRIVQIVGGFHIDEYGGIVRELRHNKPNLRILTILLEPDLGASVPDRADIIINTKEPKAP